MSRTINEVNLSDSIPITFKQMFVARRALSNLLIQNNMVKLDFKEADPELNDRELQSYLKEIIGNLEEELYEAFDEVEEWVTPSPNPTLISTTIKVKEEFADTTHFLFELFIYSGIDEDWLSEKLMEVIKEVNWASDIELLTFNERAYAALRRIAIQNNFEKYKIRGGTIRNSEIHDLNKHHVYLSNIQRYLKQSRYLLKNRAWKRMNQETNYPLFKEKVFSAFVYYFMYLEFLGIADTMIEDYLCKNIINFERIENV